MTIHGSVADELFGGKINTCTTRSIVTLPLAVADKTALICDSPVTQSVQSFVSAISSPHWRDFKSVGSPVQGYQGTDPFSCSDSWRSSGRDSDRCQHCDSRSPRMVFYAGEAS